MLNRCPCPASSPLSDHGDYLEQFDSFDGAFEMGDTVLQSADADNRAAFAAWIVAAKGWTLAYTDSRGDVYRNVAGEMWTSGPAVELACPCSL